MTPGRRHHSACFYRLALRLEEIADELILDDDDADGRLGSSARALRYRVAEIRKDNPECWATAGNCGRCDPVTP